MFQVSDMFAGFGSASQSCELSEKKTAMFLLP
jgi:hypothetical protein